MEKDKEFLKEYEETETPIEKILSYITAFSVIILILILIFFIILALLESEFCIDQKIINIRQITFIKIGIYKPCLIGIMVM